MSTIQELFQQAQLAEAAYADFSDPLKTKLQALEDNGFSATQATDFLSHWRYVAPQYTAPSIILGLGGSGFSATLFESVDNPGQYSLAMRGTAGATDLLADAGDVLTDGVAFEQIVDMYNYWQSLTHKGVYDAKILDTNLLETTALKTAYLLNPVGGLAYESTLRADGYIIDNPSHTVLSIRPVPSTELSDVNLRNGTGVLPATATVSVDGHSLGGHLAMAFSRLFPSATVDVTAVNGAGFGFQNSNVDALFTQLNGASEFDASKITNVVGSAAMNLVSQDWLFLQQPAGRTDIFTETALGNTLGHGKEQMTDSLAVYSLFAQLDPGLNNATDGLQTITGILKAESNVPANTLESSVSALGKDDESRLADYRGLFRSELDEAALDDIRLALAQGQPLGSERFREIMCAAVGVRRAQRRPGRPMAKREQKAQVEDQSDFGF